MNGVQSQSLVLCTVLLATIASLLGCRADIHAQPCFTIEIVDEHTDRGVPLVELRTVNEIRYYTDSGGVVAFYEPGLMDQEVFFHVSSHGYEFAADGLGYRGRALRTTPGGAARLSIRRVNTAERLYRITGQGIYRDTLLAGRRAPIKQPLLNGRVLGQDSVVATCYRGRIYWFWGDTNRESYPLGHFATSGAVSDLPGKGGLDPGVGVDLTYFVDRQGFSKKMLPLPGGGMIWIDGLLTLKDPAGRERLLAHYSRMKDLNERLEHGLAVFNDKTETFDRLVQFKLDARLFPGGQAVAGTVGGQRYYYFADLGQSSYPFVRVKAEWRHVLDPESYEAFTPLAAGSAYGKDSPKLDRGPDGSLMWSWKANTSPVGVARQRELIAGGKIKPGEAWIDLRDVKTGTPVHIHAACVRWNGFRRRWVMIAQQVGGSSHLGEIWYAEADAPEGPWRQARKIVTHDRYTFYNPVHHAFFDQDGGRVIYFEATYTRSFSGVEVSTPRYDYNQIMYRLDLADPRLALPGIRRQRAAGYRSSVEQMPSDASARALASGSGSAALPRPAR